MYLSIGLHARSPNKMKELSSYAKNNLQLQCGCATQCIFSFLINNTKLGVTFLQLRPRHGHSTHQISESNGAIQFLCQKSFLYVHVYVHCMELNHHYNLKLSMPIVPCYFISQRETLIKNFESMSIENGPKPIFRTSEKIPAALQKTIRNE